ncbi:RBBP9/YdeN family alpha/beta hydrolase [Hymenobacter guriensis]|uniref:Alpha/beta hydrolase n=1 Tax=Hymenobacter guriensis TaxID=2793065 RepID=A0ABS0KX99_9BACT|nr:alpha/beta hydrolase [Hymenobacter guriensis]MBG8552470.1 alpha/beta hydrolase [Hymenobacter guriensis]
MASSVLLLPGLGNSGPQHWQTQWEQHYGYLRANQLNWDQPTCHDWVQMLDWAVAAAGPDVVVVAHSLGCATVAHWAATTNQSIRAALLVAPADVDRPDFPSEVTGFAPMPLAPLPFPSIVAASTNDEYVTLPRARLFADAWGSRLVNVGALGHINSASELGLWPQGHALLRELVG